MRPAPPDPMCETLRTPLHGQEPHSSWRATSNKQLIFIDLSTFPPRAPGRKELLEIVKKRAASEFQHEGAIPTVLTCRPNNDARTGGYGPCGGAGGIIRPQLLKSSTSAVFAQFQHAPPMHQQHLFPLNPSEIEHGVLLALSPAITGNQAIPGWPILSGSYGAGRSIFLREVRDEA